MGSQDKFPILISPPALWRFQHFPSKKNSVKIHYFNFHFKKLSKFWNLRGFCKNWHKIIVNFELENISNLEQIWIHKKFLTSKKEPRITKYNIFHCVRGGAFQWLGKNALPAASVFPNERSPPAEKLGENRKFNPLQCMVFGTFFTFSPRTSSKSTILFNLFEDEHKYRNFHIIS